MKIIGITGRSGCGKSTVRDFFAKAGYPCIDADACSREIYTPGSTCLTLLCEEFGADILDENGALRRRLLADRAFATPEGTACLTQITLPEILRRIEARLRDAQAAGCTMAFIDGATIVGSPIQEQCDHLIVVTAPYGQSVQRICRRDGISDAMARRRLDAQRSEEALRTAADFEIVNDGTLPELLTQCQDVLSALQREENG